MEHCNLQAQVQQELRAKLSPHQKPEEEMENFLDAVARSLRESGIKVRTMVTGTLPVRTIVNIGHEEDVDMIMNTSRGRGGLELFMVGSKAQRVVEQTEKNVFMIPIRDRPA